MWIALVALLLCAPTRRDEEKIVDVKCPVDKHTFKAVFIKATNIWGGVDADFCKHAYQTRPLRFRVWTCPTCKFTGAPEDFGVDPQKLMIEPKENEPRPEYQKLPEISKELAERLTKELKPARGIPKESTQRDIPGWVKFDLMAQTYAILGKRRLDLGRAQLYGAWDHRQNGAITLDDFVEFEDLRKQYGLDVLPFDLANRKIGDRTEYELAKARLIRKDLEDKKFKGVNVMLAKYLAAMLFRKHGENADALALLDQIGADDLKGNSIVDAAVKKTKQSMDDELSCQKKALEEFEASIEKDTLKPEEKGDVHYMIGEIARRLGDKAKARDQFQKCVDLQGAVPRTQKLAAQQIELVK